MKPTVAVLFADAGAAALVDALKVWRQQYVPASPYEELLAAHIRVIEIKTRILPEGREIITVSIKPTRYGNGDGYYYEATLAGGELKLERIT